MPFVTIHMLKGKSSEYKQAVKRIVWSALAEAYALGDHVPFQVVHEHEAENFDRLRPSEDFVVVEVKCFAGRCRALKRRLFQLLVDNLRDTLKIDPHDVLIIINDIGRMNWGIRGGAPADEIELEYEVELDCSDC